MTKLLKFAGKFTAIFGEWFVILFILFAFLVRTSPVQTFLAQKATSYFSKELKTDVSIGRVSIVFFNRLVLDEVNIEDRKGDKIAYMKSLFLTLRGVNQIKREVRLKQVKVENGIFHLYQSKSDGTFNFDFLIDYFSSTDTTNKSKPYTFKVEQLALKNMDMSYDDYRVKPTKDEIDYDHIHLTHFYLFANKFSYNQGTIKAAINHISLREKCGLQIRRFSGYAKVNDTGIRFKELRFKTNRSTAYLPKFQMLYTKWDDFLEFDDKVYFDAVLNKSYVAMRDIQYFSSELDGMDQFCEVEAIVSQRLKEMDIRDLNLKFGKASVLKGHIVLPDFRDLHNLKYNEDIEYCYFPIKDIEQFNFPKLTNIAPIDFNAYFERFKHFEGKKIRIRGTNQHCKVYGQQLTTAIGSVRFPSGVVVDYRSKMDEYDFKTIDSISTPFFIDSLHLGKLINSSSLGNLAAHTSFKGTFDFDGKFDIHRLDAKNAHCNINAYNYHNIVLKEVSYLDNQVTGALDINDQHLSMQYKGVLRFEAVNMYQFSAKVDYVNLNAIHLVDRENALLEGEIEAEVSGNDFNTLEGKIKVKDAKYTENDAKVDLDYLTCKLNRGDKRDVLKLTSSIVDVDMDGDLALNTLFLEVNNKLSEALPALIPKQKVVNEKQSSDWSYSVDFNKPNQLLHLFVPDLFIAKGTKIKGDFKKNGLDISLSSPKLGYGDFIFKGFKSEHHLNGNEIESTNEAKKLSYRDSISIEDFSLFAKGVNNDILTTLQWNSLNKESVITWNTILQEGNKINFSVLPSYFHLNDNRWDLFQQSDVKIERNYVQLDNFKLQHKKEMISLDGVLSDNSDEFAKLDIQNFDLENISKLFRLNTKLQGSLDASARVSNPFSGLDLAGEATLHDLFINKEEVGTIHLLGEWEKEFRSVYLRGDMAYRNLPTFNFDGRYFVNKEYDNLSFDLLFNRTDIQFANAFIDPQILSHIEGNLIGKMHVGGELSKPRLEGEVDLVGGRVKVDLFNVSFGLQGKILADKDGFYVNNMPVKDEEGKTGSMVATIYHQNFFNWNFDLDFNLEEDITTIPGMRMPLDRYLVMNTSYKEGDIYYGKGYAIGRVNISGGVDNLSVTTNLTTKNGTQVNFPMYGATEVEEGNFITFLNKNTSAAEGKAVIDFTGVELDLNFNVNPQAKIKLIFNERLGDEITAYGQGDINIKMNRAGEMKMNGQYRIKNENSNLSTYNFVLGPIKQNFIIQENGTISWNGNPYVAYLDLTTYYNVFTNLKEILPVQTSTAQTIQEVKCNLKLSETIDKPKVSFELELAKAGTGVNDDAKAAIAGINSRPDELNKQFFSLLLWKKFQPLLSSSSSVGSNAVADIVSNQINSLLGDLSKDYKFNVSYNVANTANATQVDPAQSTSKMAVGVTKDYLGGKLLVNGSVGRSSYTNQSMLIGNLSFEYKLNEDGTVRLIGFNETNDFNVSAQLNSRTTQGGGINYQEEFSTLNEFSLYKYLLGWINNEPTKKDKKKKTKRKEIPKELLKPSLEETQAVSK